MRIYNILILFFFSVIVTSCNQLSNDIAGEYNMDSCIANDNHYQLYSNMHLVLNKNKRFVIKLRNRDILGKWDCYDDGDHTIVELHVDSPNISDFLSYGVATNKKILIDFNPEILLSDSTVKYLSFSHSIF
jgi:hypothetical protein